MYRCTGSDSKTYDSKTFTIEVVNLCIYDAITLSTESVSSSEDQSVKYTSVSSIPRLVDSQKSSDGPLKANIAGRFTHNDTSCTFTNYRISHVVDKDGANLTDAQVLERYSVTISGDFSTMASTNITNDLVYIEASNGYTWGGADNYLIDYSFAAKYTPPVPVKNIISKSLNLATTVGKEEFS